MAIKKEQHEIRQNAVEKLMEELYSDYLKNKLVYEYLLDNNKEDVDEDIDALKDTLSIVRKKAKKLSDSLGEDEKSDELTELGIKISNLNGRIDFCQEITAQVDGAKSRLAETVMHYKTLQEISNKGFYEDPEVK